jgi:hypothetical protein
MLEHDKLTNGSLINLLLPNRALYCDLKGYIDLIGSDCHSRRRKFACPDPSDSFLKVMLRHRALRCRIIRTTYSKTFCYRLQRSFPIIRLNEHYLNYLNVCKNCKLWKSTMNLHNLNLICLNDACLHAWCRWQVE